MIISTLDLIQSSFNTNINKEATKFIEALDAAYMLGKEAGGKILLFNASHSIREHV
jgi:hypothetical protein